MLQSPSIRVRLLLFLIALLSLLALGPAVFRAIFSAILSLDRAPVCTPAQTARVGATWTTSKSPSLPSSTLRAYAAAHLRAPTLSGDEENRADMVRFEDTSGLAGVLKYYDSLEHNIERTDMWRYAKLWLDGGLYADSDITPRPRLCATIAEGCVVQDMRYLPIYGRTHTFRTPPARRSIRHAACVA